MKMKNYVAIFNDGNLTLKDFKLECRDEGWLPICASRSLHDNSISIPVFSSEETAHKFLCRNFDTKKYVCGLIKLSDDDILEMSNRGVSIERLSFAKKIRGHKDFELDVFVFEVDEKPELDSYGKIFDERTRAF